MKKINKKNNIFKIIIGFLIPYIIINGIVLMFIIATPSIHINNDVDKMKNGNVRFSIKSLLPITKMSITKDENKQEYYKDGNEYVIPVVENGAIKIEVTSLNNMTVSTYVEISVIDDVGPTINIEDAIFAAGTLTIGITDNDSGINYDNIYGIINGEKIQPIFIDKSTGTVKFKIEPNQSITIHVEDNKQNSSETTFEAG